MMKFILMICLIGIFNLGFSQTFIPGNIYFDTLNYVEYRAGNLPIIISAPHGGSLKPASIPDRTCAGCVFLKDSWTQPIAEGLYDAIFEQTGCYPHVIINLLHRVKFDANRDIADAADGNPTVEQTWWDYHAFIDSAKAQVVKDYGRGQFLDLHGHAHSIQRIELGYLLSKAELQLPDSELNAPSFIEESSIRTLTDDNIQNHSHATLLRGEDSFGTLLANNGFPSVPSLQDPFPQGTESYFSGGYNTARHGSRDNIGEIDAIQIELNQDIRFDDSTRLVLIDQLAESALEHYDLHYNDQFEDNFCGLISTATKQHNHSSITLFPNPTDDYFIVNGDLDFLEVRVCNTLGQKVLFRSIWSGERVDISGLGSGVYFVQLFHESVLLETVKMMVGGRK